MEAVMDKFKSGYVQLFISKEQAKDAHKRLDEYNNIME
jgi:hypothetical protein